MEKHSLSDGYALWVAKLCAFSAHASGGKTVNAYCLFCNTIKRNDVAEAIRQQIGGKVLVPKIIQRKWVKGKAFEQTHDYLPGYLFLYAEEPLADFAPLYRLTDIYRVLGERDHAYCLSGPDLAFAQMLYDCDGTIGVLRTIREGEKVKLAEGTMGGVDGKIIKLDRRGRALVRFDFDGAAIQSWVAIEMIEDKPMPNLTPTHQ